LTELFRIGVGVVLWPWRRRRREGVTSTSNVQHSNMLRDEVGRATFARCRVEARTQSRVSQSGGGIAKELSWVSA